MKRKLLSLFLATSLVFTTVGCSINEEDEKKSSKFDIDDALEEAEELMDDEEWKDAVELYKEILENDDECVEAYLNLAECYINLDKMDKAEKILSKGLKKTDKNKKIKKMYDKYFIKDKAEAAASTEVAVTSEDSAIETTDTNSVAVEATAEAAIETTYSEDLYDASYEVPHTATNDGNVLNIYVWNEEFITRVAGDGYSIDPIYPGYEYIDSTTGRIGNVTVNWIINYSEGNNYLDNLDLMLDRQLNGELNSEDKIDIFLVEADYIQKYTGSDSTLKMNEIGLDDYIFNDQYDYTKQIGSYYGDLKAVTWQICPGGLIYNREIAKKVLGSDDPKTVQEAVKDWDSYLATAKKISKKGYLMNGSIEDTYRVYANNKGTPWVEDDNIEIDDNLIRWVDDTKELYKAKAIPTDNSYMWSDEWANGFNSGKTFCYFGPSWFINYSMNSYDNKSVAAKGGWGLVAGPQPFYWGGTWICAANGTDNKDLVADLIRTMTTDENILYTIASSYEDTLNSKSINNSSFYDDYNSDILGSQNPMPIFHDNALKLSNYYITAYDASLDQTFKDAFIHYINGDYSFEDSLDEFYNSVYYKFPTLNH